MQIAYTHYLGKIIRFPLIFQEYLADKGFVHRDLAARNVLIGANKTAKISDFGLARQINDEEVYMAMHNRKLPIKWMSVEAIFEQIFTTYFFNGNM